MPQPGTASAWVRRRRRRRRQWVMALLGGLTVASLVIIAGFVRQISQLPVQAKPAALIATTHTVHHSPSPRPRPRPSPTAPARQVTDASTGLSYRLLSSPWQPGCPN